MVIQGFTLLEAGARRYAAVGLVDLANGRRGLVACIALALPSPRSVYQHASNEYIYLASGFPVFGPQLLIAWLLLALYLKRLALLMQASAPLLT